METILIGHVHLVQLQALELGQAPITLMEQVKVLNKYYCLFKTVLNYLEVRFGDVKFFILIIP